MTQKIAAVLLGLCLAVAGCSYPTATVKTAASRPQLAFVNASPAAEIIVDGIPMGPASRYDGKAGTLALDAGTHRLEVREGRRILYADSVFLSGEAVRSITIPR